MILVCIRFHVIFVSCDCITKCIFVWTQVVNKLLLLLYINATRPLWVKRYVPAWAIIIQILIKVGYKYRHHISHRQSQPWNIDIKHLSWGPYSNSWRILESGADTFLFNFDISCFIPQDAVRWNMEKGGPATFNQCRDEQRSGHPSGVVVMIRRNSLTVSQMRATPCGLSRTSGKLWQDYSNCYMFWT